MKYNVHSLCYLGLQSRPERRSPNVVIKVKNLFHCCRCYFSGDLTHFGLRRSHI